MRVITTKDERSGLTGKLIKDDGSDQPFLLEFDGSPPRQDGNQDWFGTDEVEQVGQTDMSGVFALAAALPEAKSLRYLECARALPCHIKVFSTP